MTHNRHRTRSRIWYRLQCPVLSGKGDQRLASSLEISRANQAGFPFGFETRAAEITPK